MPALFRKIIVIGVSLFCIMQAHANVHDLHSILKVGDGNGAAITMSGAGTTRFLQFFFYETGCSTLLGASSIIDNSSGLPFSNGQTVSFDSGSIYTIATNVEVTPSQVGCMKVYMDGGAQSTSGISCQTFSSESCSGSTCNSNQGANSATWGTPTACATRYAYISQFNTNSTQNIYRCQIESNGTLDNCELTGPSPLKNATLGSTVSNGYIYISNNPASTPQVSYCPVVAATGLVDTTLSNCRTASEPSGVTFKGPKGVTISAGYAYLLDGASSSNLYPCVVSPSHSSPGMTCSSGIDSGLDDPRGIAMNNGYLYISNNAGGLGNGTISICQVSDGAVVGSCSTASVATAYADSPRGVAVYNNYLYFVNDTVTGTGGAITSCSINTDGTLGTCADTGSGISAFGNPQGIAIYNGYVYVTDTANHVLKCTLSGDGTITNGSCVQTATTDQNGDTISISSPTGISIF